MSYARTTRGSSRGRRSGSLLLVALAMIALVGAANWVGNRGKAQPTTATLLVLDGRATVARADAGTDPPLLSGQSTTLQQGDEVRTEVESKAKLTLSGGETIELGSETLLGILELYQSALSRALVVDLNLEQGTTLTRIRHTLLGGMQFAIETRVASVRVRGTVFQCDVLNKNAIYVAAYDGVVNVSMGEQSLDLQTGQAVRAELQQPLVATALTKPMPADSPSETTAAPTIAPTLSNWEKTAFPAIVTPTRPGDDERLYTVQAGDTLYSIAREAGVGWEEIWKANQDVLPKPELIRPGQTLRIPGP